MSRVLSTIFIIFSILVLPYWLYMPILGAAIIFFPFYWEGIILAFIVDVLYGTSSHQGISMAFPQAIGALVLVTILLPLKERLRHV